MRPTIAVVVLLAGCGNPPGLPADTGPSCDSRPVTCEVPDAAPDSAPSLVGNQAVEVAVNLDASSQSGPGRLRYWLTGSEPLNLRLNVGTQGGHGAQGAFFLDGIQVPVRIDGSDPALTFTAPDGPSLLEVASAIPTGVSAGSLVLWIPGQPKATTGHTLTVIHDACDFVGDLPVKDATVTSRGEPTLLDPQTGDPMQGEPQASGTAPLGVQPCLGGTRSVTSASSCSSEDYLLVALIDGKQGWFAGDVRVLRVQAPTGFFAETAASLQTPDDGAHHEVLFLQLPSYRRWQIPDSLGTTPVELGRYLLTGNN